MGVECVLLGYYVLFLVCTNNTFVNQNSGPVGTEMIIGVFLAVRIAKIISALRLQTANLTDKRVQLTNEVISGVQVIKMYAWEERFNQLVVSARK